MKATLVPVDHTFTGVKCTKNIRAAGRSVGTTLSRNGTNCYQIWVWTDIGDINAA